MKTIVIASLGFLSLAAVARCVSADVGGNCLGMTPANDQYCQKLAENACSVDPICNWIPSDEIEVTGSNS